MATFDKASQCEHWLRYRPSPVRLSFGQFWPQGCLSVPLSSSEDLPNLPRADGKELLLIILATIGTICAPTNKLSSDNVLIWIAIWRIILGVGIGGDYPLSASVVCAGYSCEKHLLMCLFLT